MGIQIEGDGRHERFVVHVSAIAMRGVPIAVADSAGILLRAAAKNADKSRKIQ